MVDEKNILASLRDAKDPDTGAKLDFNDLLINSNTLLFLTLRNITD